MYFVKNLRFFGNHSIPRHGKLNTSTIPFYHLVFVLKGKQTYFADGVEYELTENDALLLKPGTVRERLASSERAHYIIFNFEVFDGKDPDIELYTKSAVNKNIKHLLTMYPYTHVTSPTDPQNHDMQKAYDLMTNILNCVLIELLDSQKFGTKNPHIINALKYINDHITSPITLNDVSRAVHLTKEYTAKIFKEQTGKTVTEYINEQKMILARDMLNNNEMPLQDIAFNLGYENYSYFSRLFKKHFKLSPIKIKNTLK